MTACGPAFRGHNHAAGAPSLRLLLAKRSPRTGSKRFLLSSERFADPVVGKARVLDGRLGFRHVTGGAVFRAYGAGRAWVIFGCFCAWLIDVTLQTA